MVGDKRGREWWEEVVGGSGGRKWREEAGVGMIVRGKRGRKGGSKKGRLWWREGVSEGKE